MLDGNAKNKIIKLLDEEYSFICFAYIFGSYTSGKTNKFSDFDIAVFIAEENLNEFSSVKIQFSLDIEHIVKRNVDVVVLNTSPPLLTYQILNKGELIINKDSHKLTGFKVASMFKYFSFKNISDKMFVVRKKRIMEKAKND